MPSTQSVFETNRNLAERINKEARANPQSPYANKYVGIVNGQVAVVADTFEEMSRQMDRHKADPQVTFWIEASRDYDEVHEIWGLI